MNYWNQDVSEKDMLAKYNTCLTAENYVFSGSEGKDEDARAKEIVATVINWLSVSDAVDVLIEALKEKSDESNSYFYGWQSNIAMAFKDEVENHAIRANESLFLISREQLHQIANNAAISFLTTLINNK